MMRPTVDVPVIPKTVNELAQRVVSLNPKPDDLAVVWSLLMGLDQKEKRHLNERVMKTAGLNNTGILLASTIFLLQEIPELKASSPALNFKAVLSKLASRSVTELLDALPTDGWRPDGWKPNGDNVTAVERKEGPPSLMISLGGVTTHHEIVQQGGKWTILGHPLDELELSVLAQLKKALGPYLFEDDDAMTEFLVAKGRIQRPAWVGSLKAELIGAIARRNQTNNLEESALIEKLEGLKGVGVVDKESLRALVSAPLRHTGVVEHDPHEEIEDRTRRNRYDR